MGNNQVSGTHHFQFQSFDQYPNFKTLMSLWVTFPGRQDKVTQFHDKWTDPANIVTNGPFTLKEVVPADHATPVVAVIVSQDHPDAIAHGVGIARCRCEEFARWTILP